jgi:hypothetical protein
VNERDASLYHRPNECEQRVLKNETQANVLRDFEFIHSNRWKTRFVKDIAASRLDNGPGSTAQAAILSELGLLLPSEQRTLYSDTDLLGSFDPSLLRHSASHGWTRGSSWEKREACELRAARVSLACRRFTFAIAGGIGIVAPVLGMAYHAVELKNAILLSTAILTFAIGVALFSAAAPENLLAATAAYAAVLAVFIKGRE